MGRDERSTAAAARAESAFVDCKPPPVSIRACPRDQRLSPHPIRSHGQGPFPAAVFRAAALTACSPGRSPVCCPSVWSSRPGDGLLIFIPGCLRERIIFLGTGHRRRPLPIPLVARSSFSKPEDPDKDIRSTSTHAGGSAPRSGQSTTPSQLKWPLMWSHSAMPGRQHGGSSC